MTNIKKKVYESPKLTAEGTIAGLTQGTYGLSGAPATTGASTTNGTTFSGPT